MTLIFYVFVALAIVGLPLAWAAALLAMRRMK